MLLANPEIDCIESYSVKLCNECLHSVLESEQSLAEGFRFVGIICVVYQFRFGNMFITTFDQLHLEVNKYPVEVAKIFDLVVTKM